MQINDEISKLRLIAGKRSEDEPQPSTSGQSKQESMDAQQARRAGKAAEDAILEAERFRAQVQTPNRGINFNNKSTPRYSLEQIRHIRSTTVVAMQRYESYRCCWARAVNKVILDLAVAKVTHT